MDKKDCSWNDFELLEIIAKAKEFENIKFREEEGAELKAEYS